MPRFSLEVSALPADIDDVNHVSNLVYVRWIQEVAVAHSTAVGWPFDRYRQHGAVFVVRRHEIDYVAPVMLGQTVRLETWVESAKAASCVRRTQIYAASEGRSDGKSKEQLVCRGTTLWAFMGFADGRPQRIPEQIRQSFQVGEEQ
jgi:acyl-CoA thioester hydrolase